MAYGSYGDIPEDYLTSKIEENSQIVQQVAQTASISTSGTTDGQIAVWSVSTQTYSPGTFISGDGIGAAYSSSPFGLAISVNNAATLRTSLSIDAIATKKSNLAAAVAPTINEDSGDGYAIGSIWIDTTADDAYIALDVTVGAAVWKKITP